jgi:ankyrin repeat protein
MLYLFILLSLFSASCGGKVNSPSLPFRSPSENEDLAHPPVSPITVTALYKAIQDGDVEQVRKLVESGKIDLTQADSDGNTPLFISLNKGRDYENVSRLLIDRGADLKAKDKYGNSALHVCAYNGSVDMLKFLWI